MHTRAFRHITVFVLLGLMLGLVEMAMSHSAQAQTMQITITNYSFQPATLAIPVGTTVTWINQDSVSHTSTSDTGPWDSGTLAHGQSFSFTFNQPGTFTYRCVIHPFMKGTIDVGSAASATIAPTSTSSPTLTAAPVATVAPTALPTATSIPLAAYPLHPQRGMRELRMGPVTSAKRPIWAGYYDGHKDIYLSTDVSNQGQALAMHINFAPSLRRTSIGVTPPIYLVKGRAGGNQGAVFGSEPGEKDYSPLWREIIVQWKQRAKAVLLVSDNQILALAKKGKLTISQSNIVLNCPIIKVGR